MLTFLNRISNNLYWRISGVFLLMILLIGLVYVFITAFTAQRYYAETTQRLNADVADHLLVEVKPFVNGKVNEESLGTIMHSMMAVNPSIEVYLLDPDGKILSFVVLEKKVKLQYVSISPIKRFLESNGKELILGDDPRNPKKSTVFSATKVEENGQHLGYVYMVLASEQYENISETVWNSYLLSLGTRFFGLSLAAAFVLGLVIIWLLTRNLRKIIHTVRKFEKGDLHARIPITSTGELAKLSYTFNQMADTILQNIEDLKQVDTLRRELIANVSHDLRTPLAVISGYVETLMMKQGKLSMEQEKKYLGVIMQSSEHLSRLVSDLFELSKLEARQVELNKQPFVLAELLQDVSAKYSLMAEEKQLSITAQISAREARVNGDLKMIERVLQNLIENAIKHSPENSEIILNLSEADSKLELSVKNTGVGIPEEDLPKIFDRYYKAEKHYGERKGTGLGLAIVKNILEMHESIIKVKSKVGEYTSFAFALPVYQ
ncbi:MAG: HAMP domain-containing histidine kinase [Bacteroidia bacterium]|nr:HAMP domain-containing histidine kinase [Bacteroidia bacterium]